MPPLLYSPNLLELRVYATAVTNDRLAIVIVLRSNSAVLAVAQSFILTTHVRSEFIKLSSHSSSSTKQGKVL